MTGKRKRNQISYAEPDHLDDSDDELEREVEDDLMKGDSTYGSPKVSLLSLRSIESLANRLPQICGRRRKSARTAKQRNRLAPEKPKTSKPQKPFPFLLLPAELRDYIYELALTNKNGITLASSTKAFRRIVVRREIDTVDRGHWTGVIHNSEDNDSMPKHENSLSPNLLAVNKQVHAEAAAWLYQQPLIVEDTMALHTFIASIGPASRQRITELRVKGWGVGRGTHKAMNVAALTGLADCTNLKKLYFDCDIGYSRRDRDLARQLYRDGHYFFERFGAVNGRRDAILDVLRLSDPNFENVVPWGYAPQNLTTKDEDRDLPFRNEMKRLLGAS